MTNKEINILKEAFEKMQIVLNALPEEFKTHYAILGTKQRILNLEHWLEYVENPKLFKEKYNKTASDIYL